MVVLVYGEMGNSLKNIKQIVAKQEIFIKIGKSMEITQEPI